MARPTADDGAHDLLSDSLALARTQLASQVADENSLDGRTMGTLGFNGGRRFTAKRRALQAALLILAFGLPVSALLIGLS
jgi:hypothetical protein